MKLLKYSFVPAFLLIILFFGCQDRSAKSGQQVLSEAEIESKFANAIRIWPTFCASCHGAEIEAYVDREWKQGKEPENLKNRIRSGDIKDGMPAFGAAFTEEELQELVDYILYNIENRAVYEFEDRPDISGLFETEQQSFSLEIVTDGLDYPWGMAFLPGGDILLTDRGGNMYRWSEGNNLTTLSNIPEVVAEGQGGLLDVELHPDFQNNKLIYLSYSLRSEENEELATTAVARAVLNGSQLEEVEVIFEALPYAGTRHHYGSRLEFDREGYLYFSVGDRGNRDENPQATDNHCGKILRINDDGSIPEGNPFINVEGAMPEIYSYGHRNPQGVIMHPGTGEIWTHEHGPRGGDEINIITPGRNFGWPVISYGINYNGTPFTSLTEQEGMEEPLHYWVPSIAPCGMTFITGNKYPGWEGDLMVGSLRFQYLHRCKIRDNSVIQEEILLKNIGRLRNVKQGPDGFIYIAVEEPGVIYKLIPVE